MCYNKSMDFTEHLIEYYDELYPVTDELTFFFETELHDYPMPAKILTIGCCTGLFEHRLAESGFDITGTGVRRECIDTAVRRHRTPNAAIRFFQMTPLEIGRFLAKDFYHCAVILDGFIYFIHDKTLLRKFFYDCRSVIVKGGRLVLHIPDISKTKESPRVKLIAHLQDSEDEEKKLLTQTLEKPDANGGKKHIPVRSRVPVYISPMEELAAYAREAGFKSAKFYKAWNTLPIAAETADIAVFS